MKNIFVTILTALVLTSCAEKKEVSLETLLATNDVAKIKAKKATMDAKQQLLSTDLKAINDKLDALIENKNIPLITALTVKETVFTHFIELQGNVQTKQNILIYPELPGILKTMLVKEGQQVVKGQVLATI